MTKQPYMPLFFGDFIAATTFWEGEERALYLLLLGYQWTNGPLPPDPRKLARFIGYDTDNFLRLWQTVGTKFKVTAEGLINERLEAHRTKAAEISAKRAAIGSKGGKAKRSSKRGKQNVSKQKAIASCLPEQLVSNGHSFAMPSNPIQSKLNPEEEEAHEEGGNLQ